MNSRRWLNIVTAVGMLAALIPAGQVEASAARQTETGRETRYVPGEVVVTFGEGTPAAAGAAQASALAGSVGAQVAASYDNLALLSFSADADVQALAEQVAQSGQVTSAQPNYVYHIPEDGSERALQSGTLSDSGYRVQIQAGREKTLTRAQLSQMRTVIRRSGKAVIRSTFPNEAVTSAENTWGWDRVNAEIIWANTNVSPAICVVDTGVDAKHKDLYGRVINGYDFVNDDRLPADDNGHGTHVAGTAAALGNNGGTTAIGVSNGRVVAVKSLNAQGWGTTFSIAAGIRFCAARADVAVINLSLGAGDEDAVEYDALKYAIVTQKKVVTAAAGNSYSADLLYPAAWGDPAVTAPGGGTNEIAGGLISVAAARINPPTYPVWVDTNHSQKIDPGEYYEYKDCAVSFTSFGKHINLVAPGHLIYSTTPTSYPFFNQYYYGDRAGYEIYSGTSMASPFVAGAAARVLSVFPNLGKAGQETVKQRLVSSGKALTYAVDPMNGEAGFDPAHPYAYGQYFNNGMVAAWPVEGGGSLNAIRAPFCWPNATGPYTAAQDMSSARYLNVAAAMRRFGTLGEIFDAATALPLKDAVVRVKRQDGVVMDTVKVGAQGATVMLMNLPMIVTDTMPEKQTYYYFEVYKPGYTAGYQIYGYTLANFTVQEQNEPYFGDVSMTPTSSVAVPVGKDINAVLNWLPLNENVNLDLYLWTPQDSAKPGYISSGWMPYYFKDYNGAPNLGQGTLLPPAAFGGSASPYAQLMHDGGGEGVASDILPFDTISIKAKPKTAQPWYSGTTDSYHLLVTDYSRVYPEHDSLFPLQDYLTCASLADCNNPIFAAPVLRIWKNGRLAWDDIIQIYYQDENNAIHLGENCEKFEIDWWHAADLNGSVVTPGKKCGDGQVNGGMYILPYQP